MRARKPDQDAEAGDHRDCAGVSGADRAYRAGVAIHSQHPQRRQGQPGDVARRRGQTPETGGRPHVRRCRRRCGQGAQKRRRNLQVGMHRLPCERRGRRAQVRRQERLGAAPQGGPEDAAEFGAQGQGRNAAARRRRLERPGSGTCGGLHGQSGRSQVQGARRSRGRKNGSGGSAAENGGACCPDREDGSGCPRGRENGGACSRGRESGRLRLPRPAKPTARKFSNPPASSVTAPALQARPRRATRPPGRRA